MSFRLFVYYSAICGAWAALCGWALGRLPGFENKLLLASFTGLTLGATLAGVLGVVDALWNLPTRRVVPLLTRAAPAAAIGGVAGLVSSLVGQLLFSSLETAAVQVAAWAFAGGVIGAAPGLCDLALRRTQKGEVGGAIRKVGQSATGGAAGGLVGGLALVLLSAVLFPNKESAWSPGAVGVAVLGASVGLLVGFGQVLLKQAWLRVESGFRAGRELILTRPTLLIGRAERCDVGLFGDDTVEKEHARIVRHGGRYLLEDIETPGGTWLNGDRIGGPTALCDGDRIGVGRCVLLFGERSVS